MKPLAGDPAVLHGVGGRYAETADAIRAAIRELELIAAPGSMVSTAIDRVRADAAKAAQEIRAAEARYRTTGDALAGYASKLDAAQAEAARAIRDADASRAAQAGQAHRTRSLTEQLTTTDAATDPEGARLLAQRLDEARSSVATSGQEIADAERRYGEAVAARDRAAQEAIDAIHRVVEGSALNDTAWSRFTNALGVIGELLDGAMHALSAMLSALVAVLARIIGAALLLIAAVLALALLVVVALAALALLSLLLSLALVLSLFGGPLLFAMVAGAGGLLLLLAGRVLAGLGVLLLGIGLLGAINLLRGMDPVQALTQAAIPSLLAAFPELLAVIAAASAAEAGSPTRVGEPKTGPVRRGAQDTEMLMQDLKDIDQAGHTAIPPDPSTNQESVVRIIPFVIDDPEHPGRTMTVYRVHVPSTQQWTPGGTSGNDVTSDIVAKMNPAERTQLEKMVRDAMTQQVPPGSHVMLAGWSLGGITAGDLAADPSFNSTYRVDAVVTAGSSLDDLDIPKTTKVLDVSHTTDPVPRTENPFMPDHSHDPNRYKVDVPPPGGAGSLGHDPNKYQQTMASNVDAAVDGPAAEFMRYDPNARDGVQISDYFGKAGAPTDYAYHRG